VELIDSHAHLHFPEYDEDREEVIERARKAGVVGFVNIGTDLKTSQQVLLLAEQYDFMWASAGVHPHDAKDVGPTDISEIDKILGHPRVVAIGEIGLDFYRNLSKPEVQKSILKIFLGIYQRIQKPLILHCRDAYEELIEILEEHDMAPYQGIIHCFSSDRAGMERLLDLGFCIAFGGALTYKKNDVLREACKACPIEKLVLETDAPFLPPQPWRGKRNESSYLVETARVAAEIHGLSIDVLSKKTSDNVRSLLSLC